MNQTVPVSLCVLCAIIGITHGANANDASPNRPNILWITLEDVSPNLGCYGDDYAITPNIDALAAEGVRYTRVWSNAGMCAPARATLITGMYAPSTGAQNMRSEVRLPDFIRAFPEYLRKEGYFCSNHVKTDYNWQAPETTWDVQHRDWSANGWRRCAPGQPFFTVINITDTHSSQIYYRGEKNWRRRVAELGPDLVHDPAGVSVPPYYPDTPEVRGDLARYYDNITYADRLVARVLAQLEADGLADDTIVFLFSDHGQGMPRAKSWCFESSLHVPLIIRFPEKYQHLAPAAAGGTVDRLVAFVDFAPTVLSLCGVEIPRHFQGTAFLGEQAGPPRQYAYAYRDRMDERYELIRAVTDGRYKYIRNYLPHLPWFHEQTRSYPRLQPTYRIWHEWAAAGKLSGPSAIYMAHEKPREQLFDLSSDPHEVVNLANSPDHQETLRRLRRALKDWMLEIHDLGFMPEPQWFTRFEDFGDARPRYTIVRETPDQYQLEHLMAVAELVGAKGPDVVQQQRETLASPDPAVRFWAAVGLLTQPSLGVKERQALTKLLDDPTPSCRIAAAEALLRHGPHEKALEVLVECLNHQQFYVALLAANTLEHLGDAVRPVLPQLKRFLEREPSEADEERPWERKGLDEIVTRVVDSQSG